MFLGIDFPSVNGNAPPPPGDYSGELWVFAGIFEGDTLTAYVYLFRQRDAEQPTFCDLLVRGSNGRVWVRDFLKLPDLNWRDSDGRCAPDVWSLMPEAIRDLPLVKTEPLPDFEVAQ